MSNLHHKRYTLNCNGRLVCLTKPMVMGIVNVTPDSFYDGNSYPAERELLQRCETMVREGVDIIDIGAVSTRPGAQPVSVGEERKRLEYALAPVRRHFPGILVSIDTYRADIAQMMAEKYGIDFVNDISAGVFDENMFSTVARLNIPYILMHMQGIPETMQQNPVYENPMNELIRFFSVQTGRLRSAGVKDIIIDPGFGFGKTTAHNYEILRRMKDLEIFEMPILAGVSRKSMICKLLETDPQNALNGTTAVNTLALANGADIIRVHDVKEAVECVKIVQMYQQHNLSE